MFFNPLLEQIVESPFQCAGNVAVAAELLFVESRQAGWPSLMGALAIFSGAQLLMLGIIGEYVGRAFLTVAGRPQSLVREVFTSQEVPA